MIGEAMDTAGKSMDKAMWIALTYSLMQIIFAV